MKIRIKFTKTGPVRYIGHLDVMRYFQKLNRRAGLDVKYTTGFSPHQIMSFAAPLGVGLESLGEYVDIEVNTSLSTRESIEALNNASVEGIQAVNYVCLPEGTPNAMSSVTAADYRVRIKDAYKPEGYSDISVLSGKFREFLAKDSIVVLKASKKSEREVDLKPLIYDAFVDDDGSFIMKLSTGSVENLKPELVMETFYQFLGQEMNQFALDICRLEVYGVNPQNGEFIPLEKFGDIIE